MELDNQAGGPAIILAKEIPGLSDLTRKSDTQWANVTGYLSIFWSSTQGNHSR